MRRHIEIENEFAQRAALDGHTSFFLVGIGGAGMAPLARMLRHRGFRVRGTDSTESAETRRLVEEGIPVHIGHTGEGIEAGDAVVLTDAIELTTSPEVARARELGLVLVRRSQALGWILAPYRVIAITGTHGKTTTTGMTGAGLIAAGVDPVVVVGASIPQWNSPVHEGKGEWAVVEACEAYDSFHDIDPEIVVLTNLEPDHLDFHGTYENLRESVVRFVQKVGPTGKLVFCGADPGAQDVAFMANVPNVAYGLDDLGRIGGDHIVVPHLPGLHSAYNAAGALVAAEQIGISGAKAAPGVIAFGGAERRMQLISPLGSPITVIDDYAHHPTEVTASIQALRQQYVKGEGRLIVVFQPHLYSRTNDNVSGFADALSEADVVVLTDIYRAREDPMPGVSSALIGERISKPTYYVPSRHLLPREVLKIARPGDVVVGMGAGTIADFAPDFVKELARSSERRPLSIAVCYGGDSAEREVSLHSGRAILAALKRNGHAAYLVDVSDLLLSSGDLSRFTGTTRPDLAFLAVHGTNAEDGALQGLFELLHIPYTGSNIQASALAMDKAMTKRILQANGVRVPKGVLLASPNEDVPFEPPLIVKPNAQGSTVGLSFVESKEDLPLALQRAFAFPGTVLVEEWIQGMEISTPVLDNEALLPVEIAPTSGRYDFESKYKPGATKEIVPARLPDAVLQEARDIALQAHQALGCTGATRTDAIVRGDQIFVLEVNTLPGMTGTSLLPNSALAMGISFEQLCQRLVEDALSGHAPKA